MPDPQPFMVLPEPVDYFGPEDEDALQGLVRLLYSSWLGKKIVDRMLCEALTSYGERVREACCGVLANTANDELDVAMRVMPSLNVTCVVGGDDA